ncbi:MAG: polyprenol phosphomannose-dependent alpha 1,6 mannosyltransferase MptB, partial [Micromonosporaceae bacterium]|nr:polyprenol phosphomannose-dependent alpha 1,6 mannosyltransferase MptB [Micromonosporaceae bacterium]
MTVDARLSLGAVWGQLRPRILTIVGTSHASARILGIVGTTSLAIGGYGAGALPRQDSVTIIPGLQGLGHHPKFGVLCVYFGLLLLVVAWWRLLRARPAPGIRSMLVTLAAWAAPLVLAPPMFSRDVYSYLAQGVMVREGLDVYQSGPAGLTGLLAVEVPPAWQHTPCPYGPAFLIVVAAVVAVTSTKVVVGFLAMRLVALGGIALLAAALPGLARRCGVDPAAALALGVLNPLVLLHLVGGAHNEAIMLGLLAAGLALATRGRSVPAAVLVTLAALVKAPAALGLVAVAQLGATSLGGRARAAAVTGGTALATAVGVTALAGTGYGWIGALTTPVSEHSWSISHMLGHITGAVVGAADDSLIRFAQPVWTWLCMGAAAVAVFTAWRHSRQLGAVYALGLSLSAVALLGPATRPWYALWGLIPIAAAAPDGRVRRVAAIASGVFALTVLPDGLWPSLSSIFSA